MFKKRFLTILITLLALALVGVSVPVIIKHWPQISNYSKDHNYFVELPEFTLRITDDPNNTQPFEAKVSPVTMLATYVKQDTVIDMRESNSPWVLAKKTAYIFNNTVANVTTSNNTTFLLIPPDIADNIELIPGEVYEINYQIQYGWPDVYRLIIYKDDNVIFAGLSDWSIDGRFNLNKLIPIKVKQNKVLTNHYIDGDDGDFYIRITNTEITFDLDGDSTNLHQGQSATLGDYDITLLIAREIEYKPNWYDVGQNCISYVIVKRSR
jgi:hypothetical protein